MRAVDTKIVIRYLIRDEPGQTARAQAAVDAGDVFVGTTVLLESAWVLRSAYGLGGSEVTAALRRFAGLPGVTVENPVTVADSFDRAEAGMDFADALHPGTAAQCDALLTFDRRFIRMARNASVRVVEP